METTTEQKLTYRWIDGKELERLEPILSLRRWSSLNPMVSRALCGFNEDDELVCFFCLQLFPFLGPAWVKPSLRGGTVLQDMISKMKDFLVETEARGFLVIADNKSVEKLCEEYGLVKVNSPVYISR